MSTIPCPVEGCIKDAYRKGYCYAHYMKDWRYGTPTPDHGPKWQDIKGQRFGSLVVTRRDGQRWVCRCDCGVETKTKAGDLNRGTKISCGNSKLHHRKADAGYVAAHQRVRQDRGPIADHTCIECGQVARHWSYDHTDMLELLEYGLSANPVAYSLDPNHYSPRCVPCHKAFDLGRITSMAV